MMTERLWTQMWEIDRLEEIQMDHLGLVDLLAWDIKSRKAAVAALRADGRQRGRRCRPMRRR